MAYPVYFGTYLGQRLGRVVVQLQPHRNDGNTLGAGRFNVFDSIRFRNGLFNGGRYEPANQFRIGSDIYRSDGYGRIFIFGVFPDIEGEDRLQARDDNDQVDHGGQYRALNENFREGLHGLKGVKRKTLTFCFIL